MHERVPPLKSLFWEATLRCNAGCPFCGSSCGPEKRTELGAEDVLRAFARIAERWDPSGIMVHVTGGEPLLREDLFDVMEKVSRMGFPWGMVTNGSLITDEGIDRMRKAGMRTISVSIDGLAEAHEAARRLPGAFPRIVDGIRKLGEAGFLETIQITTVVTRRNLPELDRMLAFFSTLPVDSWRLVPVDPIGRGIGQQDLLLRQEDLEELFRFMDRQMFCAKPVLTTSCAHYLGRRDTLCRPDAFHCEAGRTVASILADGSVFVCPNVPRDTGLIQGNILRDDFVRLWEEGFDWFRDEGSRKTGPCADCPEWTRCRADSLHTWDFEQQSPKFCAARCDLLPKGRPEPPPALLERLRADTPSLRGIRIGYGSSSERTVYFTPAAAEYLYSFFHWGKRHPANLCEQMAAAVGRMADGQAWVEELIPVPLLDRGEKTAAFDFRLHEEVLRELEILNRNLSSCDEPLLGRETPYRLLGYLHSHPGELEAVMSRPDLELHEQLRRVTPELCFTGLVQPQRRDLCLYWDSVWSAADVVLFAEASDVEKWGL